MHAQPHVLLHQSPVAEDVVPSKRMNGANTYVVVLVLQGCWPPEPLRADMRVLIHVLLGLWGGHRRLLSAPQLFIDWGCAETQCQQEAAVQQPCIRDVNCLWSELNTRCCQHWHEFY